jgi:hypothetical protein
VDGDVVQLSDGVYGPPHDAAASPSATRCAMNMLEDSSAEEEGEGARWSVGSGGATRDCSQQRASHSGTCSLKFHFTQSHDAYAFVASYDRVLPLLPGASYVFSAYYYVRTAVNVGQGGGAYFRLGLQSNYGDFERSAQIAGLYVDLTNSIGTWQYKSTIFVVPDDVEEPKLNIFFGRMLLPSVASNVVELEMFVDDVSLQLYDGFAGATGRRCNYTVDWQ